MTFFRVLLTLALAFGVIHPVSAQSGIPQRAIPSDLSPDLRPAIEALSSTGIKTQDQGVIALRTKHGLGENVVPAVPFLTDLVRRAHSRKIYFGDAKEIGELQRAILRNPETGLLVETIVLQQTVPSRAAALLADVGAAGIEALQAVLTEEKPNPSFGDGDPAFYAAKALAGTEAGLKIAMAPLQNPVQAVAKPIYSARWAIVEALTENAKDALEAATKRGEDPLGFKVLLRGLNDTDAKIRHAAAEYLYELAQVRLLEASTVEPLVAALRDEDEQVRGSAAAALGPLRDPRAVEPLMSALADRDAAVRRIAAISLGIIGDPRAREALRTATKDRDSSVKKSANDALKKLRKS